MTKEIIVSRCVVFALILLQNIFHSMGSASNELNEQNKQRQANMLALAPFNYYLQLKLKTMNEMATN